MRTLDDLVPPASRLTPAALPKPRHHILNSAFKYTKSEDGSAVLNAWKSKRIRNRTWKGG